jgi:hypothetical protein
MEEHWVNALLQKPGGEIPLRVFSGVDTLLFINNILPCELASPLPGASTQNKP